MNTICSELLLLWSLLYWAWQVFVNVLPLVPASGTCATKHDCGAAAVVMESGQHRAFLASVALKMQHALSIPVNATSPELALGGAIVHSASLHVSNQRSHTPKPSRQKREEGGGDRGAAQTQPCIVSAVPAVITALAAAPYPVTGHVLQDFPNAFHQKKTHQKTHHRQSRVLSDTHTPWQCKKAKTDVFDHSHGLMTSSMLT